MNFLGMMSRMKILKESVTGLSVEKGWKFKWAKTALLGQNFLSELHLHRVSSLNSFLP